MAIYNLNEISPLSYISLIKSKIIEPVFRVTLLNEDETFKRDISSYVIPDESSLSIEYKQGQRRSLTLGLNNSTGEFIPNGTNGNIWVNSKIKIELGIKDKSNNEIYTPAGIFVIGTPNVTRDGGQKTISLQCYDKFALLDGTLGGTLDASYEIDTGLVIRTIIQSTLLQDNGNGFPIDSKPIIFDSLYNNTVTKTTISKSPNDSYGDMLIDLADMISCDIWYDVNGNLTIRSGTYDLSHINKPTLWQYDDTELEYLTSSIEYDFTKCKNTMVVVGANANNELVYRGVAKNTSAKSSTSIARIGTKLAYIEDSNIYNDALAQQRAEWELNLVSMIQLAISIESTYMIHLDVNQCISINDNFYGYKENRFIISSLSIPLSIDSKMTISCSNISELPFYPDN